MKALIKYSDSLLLERGEIRPEVGDKIGQYGEIVTNIYNTDDDDILVAVDNTPAYISELFVEIDYNPNDAIEFAEWLPDRYIKQMREKTHYTTEELYKEFRNERNI